MGHIHITSGQLRSLISDAAGFKTGIAVSKNNLIRIYSDDEYQASIIQAPSKAFNRIESIELESIFAKLLYSLGNIPSPSVAPNMIQFFHKYKNSPYADKLDEFLEYFVDWLTTATSSAEKSGTKSLDPTNYILGVKEVFGIQYVELGIELLLGLNTQLHRQISGFRVVEWDDQIALEELFKSESLEAKYGNFIDQRYIDYLARNLDKLDLMNWRKFEGLTAEFFKRNGYETKIGPGRNDGGVDVRVWNEEQSSTAPPLILIQCKRQKEKVEKTVVKALWADMQEENAESGLIVTTSALSDGAKSTCSARGYNIEQADKQTISKWLNAMRSPWTGIIDDDD